MSKRSADEVRLAEKRHTMEVDLSGEKDNASDGVNNNLFRPGISVYL